MYDAIGNMAVQIQPHPPRKQWTGPLTRELAYEAMRGYTAYFGTYTIDEKSKRVTHHRQGRLDGGVVDFVREFEFLPNDRVLLKTVGGTGPTVHLTWARA